MSNETNETSQRTPEQQRLYNMAQVWLIQYMISTGIIKTPAEYAQRFAPLFNMLARGEIEVDTREWEQIRADARAQIKKIQDDFNS